MRLTGSLFLIAVGAILTFAIHVQTNGFSLHTTGIILMIVGGVALVLTLALFSRRPRTVIRRGPAGEVVEERRAPDYSDHYDDAPRL